MTNMTASALIIGCGYLGSRVARLWREQDIAVYATTRRADGAAALRRAGVEPILCDVLDPEPLRRAPRFDAVLYAVGWDRASGNGMREVYVDGLARTLERLRPPRRFVYISSTSVYGQTGGEWVDEDSTTEPQEESGRIVLEAERTLRRTLPQATVVRFAGIYGPGRLLRQKAIEAGEAIVGDGDKWLNLIHVEDGARAAVLATAHERDGLLLNVADGRPVRRRDFFGELARLLGAPPPRFTAPAEGSTPPHERGQRRIDNRRLCDVLGMTFRFADYRAGLADAVGAARG